MAAATLLAVMQGVETRLKTISGLRTAAFRADQVNPPQAYVSVPNVNYHEAFAHGRIKVDLVVTVIVSKALDRIDQPALAAYADVAGTKSIHAAIEGDRTLGGAVDDCIVTDFKEADINIGGLLFYGGVFTLRAMAAGA